MGITLVDHSVRLSPESKMVPHGCRECLEHYMHMIYVKSIIRDYVAWWISENCDLVNYVTRWFIWLVNNVNLWEALFLQYIWLGDSCTLINVGSLIFTWC